MHDLENSQEGTLLISYEACKMIHVVFYGGLECLERKGYNAHSLIFIT